MMVKISDWYWIVGGDQANVWSSARAMSVPVNDADYVAWLAVPHQPTLIASMAELQDVFTAQYPPGMLETYLPSVRFDHASGGVIVSDARSHGRRQSAAVTRATPVGVVLTSR